MAAMKLFSCVLLMITITVGIAGYMAEAQDGPANAPAPCVGTLCMNDDDGICPQGFKCCRQGECDDGKGVCCDNPCDVYPCHENDDCVPWRPTCKGLEDDTVCGEGFGYCGA